MNEYSDEYARGYTRGENERIWLATANSDLRSDLKRANDTLAVYKSLIDHIGVTADWISAAIRDLDQP